MRVFGHHEYGLILRQLLIHILLFKLKRLELTFTKTTDFCIFVDKVCFTKYYENESKLQAYHNLELRDWIFDVKSVQNASNYATVMCFYEGREGMGGGGAGGGEDPEHCMWGLCTERNCPTNWGTFFQQFADIFP